MNDLEEVLLLDMAIKEARIKLEKARTLNAKRNNTDPDDLSAIEEYISALIEERESILFNAASTIAKATTPDW